MPHQTSATIGLMELRLTCAVVDNNNTTTSGIYRLSRVTICIKLFIYQTKTYYWRGLIHSDISPGDTFSCHRRSSFPNKWKVAFSMWYLEIIGNLRNIKISCRSQVTQHEFELQEATFKRIHDLGSVLQQHADQAASREIKVSETCPQQSSKITEKSGHLRQVAAMGDERNINRQNFHEFSFSMLVMLMCSVTQDTIKL